MKRIDLKTWEEFQTQVSQLDKVRSERKSATGRYVSEYLFRGQSDSLWSLKTTLERYTGRLLTLLEYYRVLCRAKPQIESFTDASWDKIPSLTEYTNQIGSEGYLPLGVFPAYEYFIYLRHFGFPSPLLDWTRSPYVAAYFAEYTTGQKYGGSNKPKITGLGPYVRGHRRHFQQQSQYTICTIHRDGKHCYARHDDAFAANSEDQDELWRFDIPASERMNFLKRLEQHNITAFSLFGSEESLMETLSFREILSRTDL